MTENDKIKDLEAQARNTRNLAVRLIISVCRHEQTLRRLDSR